MYILFIPVFTIMAFIIGTILAFAAISQNQEPNGDEPAETEGGP
jgi:hypothetical protein